jgi:hypothetical protein
MMLCNKPVRRMARRFGQTHDPSRESASKEAAEGATAPETLRQKDRDRVMNFWKVKQRLLLPPKG